MGMSDDPTPEHVASTVRAYHRTTNQNALAILRDGFRDAEGTFGTGRLWRGVWVTIERPWDLLITGPPPGEDPALLVIDGLPLEVFEQNEWVEEDAGYREALIPAEDLNQARIWRAWECVECERIAPEGAADWQSELLKWPPGQRVSVCPGCR
jgi:hypothetical protein